MKSPASSQSATLYLLQRPHNRRRPNLETRSRRSSRFPSICIAGTQASLNALTKRIVNSDVARSSKSLSVEKKDCHVGDVRYDQAMRFQTGLTACVFVTLALSALGQPIPVEG